MKKVLTDHDADMLQKERQGYDAATGMYFETSHQRQEYLKGKGLNYEPISPKELGDAPGPGELSDAQKKANKKVDEAVSASIREQIRAAGGKNANNELLTGGSTGAKPWTNDDRGPRSGFRPESIKAKNIPRGQAPPA